MLDTQLSRYDFQLWVGRSCLGGGHCKHNHIQKIREGCDTSVVNFPNRTPEIWPPLYLDHYEVCIVVP